LQFFFGFLDFLPSQQVVFFKLKFYKTSNALYAHDFDEDFLWRFTSQPFVKKMSLWRFFARDDLLSWNFLRSMDFKILMDKFLDFV